MLVRARVKRVEDLPEWAKCCGQELVIGGDELIVDVEKQQDGPDGSCCGCGGYMPPGRDVWAIAESDAPAGWVALAILDLDEGPITEAQ